MPTTPEALKRIFEAALLCAVQPMTVADFRKMFDDELPAETVRVLLDELRAEWGAPGRAAELVQLASGWRLRTRAEFMPYIERLNPDKPPKYSRAVLETLAIIAYRQPVTRGDIEDIRGVTVAATVIKTLEERGWIDVIGHRETPGRPALFATTKKFLDDLGLRSLNELPALESVDMPMLDLPEMPLALSVQEPVSDRQAALAVDQQSHVESRADEPGELGDDEDLAAAVPVAALPETKVVIAAAASDVAPPVELPVVPVSPSQLVDVPAVALTNAVPAAVESAYGAAPLISSAWPFAGDADTDNPNNEELPPDEFDAADRKED